MIWKIWKKSKWNSDKIWTKWKKGSTCLSSILSISYHYSISEMIWKILKKSKLKCEMIWKIWKNHKSNSDKIWTI